MNRPWCTNRKEAVAATLAGATAGFVDISILYPFEYCKTLLQLQRGHMKGSGGGIYNCLARQVCNNGFSSLYRGYLPVACFAIPKAGVRFGSFRFFEEKITTPDLKNDVTQLEQYKLKEQKIKTATNLSEIDSKLPCLTCGFSTCNPQHHYGA